MNTPIYDSHAHYQSFDDFGFNEDNFFKRLNDSTIRQLVIINNNHKSYLWNHIKPCFHKNTKIYNTFGIHPKYISENHFPHQLDQLENILVNEKQSRNIVAVGECGIDETSRSSLDVQIKVFRVQVILADKFHLPLVLHSRGTHAFEQMYNILSTMLNNKHPVQWHCVNANSDLSILTRFLIIFENSYVSFNGSSIFNEDLAKQRAFQAWLKANNNLLSRTVFETDFPYLKPVDLNKEEYNPISGILRTAMFFVDTLRKRGFHATKLVQISNKNIRHLFNIE